LTIESHAAPVAVSPCDDADAILDLFDGGYDVVRRAAWAAHVSDAIATGVTFLVARRGDREVCTIAYAERDGRLRILDQLVVDDAEAVSFLFALDRALAVVAMKTGLDVAARQGSAIG
jgi:hypothetical protein